MTIEEIKDTLQTWIRTADDEYDREEMGRVCGLKESLHLIEKLELPSVNPQEKTGHWIELGCVGNDNYNFECSECHHTDTQSKAVKVNYCWYCGARMIEPKERKKYDI